MSSIYFRSVRRNSEDMGLANGLISQVEIPAFVLGSEELTDPSFESWSIEYEPDDWDIGEVVKLTDTDVRTGTYALGLIPYKQISQEMNFLNLNPLTPTIWAKAPTGGDLYLRFRYESEGNTYYFNFDGDDAGTWTQTFEGNPNVKLVFDSIGTTYESLTFGGTLPIESSSITVEMWSENGQVDIDDVSFQDSVTLDEMVSNGGFENWTERDVLADWYDGNIGNQEMITDSELVKEETEVYSGDYSVKLVTGEDVGNNGSPHILGQVLENLEGQYFKFSVYSKNGTGAGQIVFVNNDIEGENEIKFYNFTGANAGTWTLSAPGGPTSDQTYSITGATEWTQVTLDNIPIPETGTTFVIMMSPSGISEYCYYDLASFKQYTRDLIEPLTLKSDLDINDILPGETLLLTIYDDATGVADNPLILGKYIPLALTLNKQNDRLSIYTDALGYNFINGETGGDAPISVGDAVLPTDATNQTNSLSVLAVIGTDSEVSVPIDFTEEAQTLLYTVPDGYDVILDRIDFTFDAENYTVGWDGSIGQNTPDLNDYNSYTAIGGTGNMTGTVSLLASNTSINNYIFRRRYTSGTEIYLKITTGATATKLEAEARVIGYLIKME